MKIKLKIPRENPQYPQWSDYVVGRISTIIKSAIETGKNLILIQTNLKRGLPLENINSEDRAINKAIKCPVCKSPNIPERKVSTKFLAIAIDEKGRVGVLKKGPSVFKTITELIDEGYNLSETPVIISRKGAGLETEYSVLPSRKDAPLTDEENQTIADFQNGYNLDQYTRPMSYECKRIRD